MTRPRLVLASSSVALILAVVAVAAALGPDQGRNWLVFAGILAVIAAMQSVASDPKDLTAALLLGLTPVIALLADGSPSWLIGPLGVLLLAAGELSALSWDCQAPGPMTAVRRRRLLNLAPLTLLGLAASLAMGLAAAVPLQSGTAAVAAAALVLAVLGRLVFRRGT